MRKTRNPGWWSQEFWGELLPRQPGHKNPVAANKKTGDRAGVLGRVNLPSTCWSAGATAATCSTWEVLCIQALCTCTYRILISNREVQGQNTLSTIYSNMFVLLRGDPWTRWPWTLLGDRAGLEWCLCHRALHGWLCHWPPELTVLARIWEYTGIMKASDLGVPILTTWPTKC